MAGCHLVVAEGDGEPPIVTIDDLNAVVSGAAEKNNDSLLFVKFLNCRFWQYVLTCV